MSTITTSETVQPRALHRSPSSIARVGFGRLIAVELRKATNTRAARALLIASCGVSLLAMVIATIVNVNEHSVGSIPMFLQFAVVFCQILLPLVAVMLVTSEWTQRTGMVTFAIEPRRALVIFAKLAASLLLAVVVAVVLGAASLGLVWVTQAASGQPADWTNWFVAVGSNVLAQLIWVLIAFALASLFLNTPAAIVGFFVVQLVFSVIFQILGQLSATKDIVPWFDISSAVSKLGSGQLFGYWAPPQYDASADWGHLVVALAVWMVLPLVLGLIRVIRAEIK
ncbi:MAG TPA: hypothetical protein VFU07_06470 [Candidatus Lumbricidophila sp.]|nr:hypothetical protein [Candidatus Lumbricidophila sp.]